MEDLPQVKDTKEPKPQLSSWRKMYLESLLTMKTLWSSPSSWRNGRSKGFLWIREALPTYCIRIPSRDVYESKDLKTLKVLLFGSLWEHVRVKDYLTLRIMFEEQDHAKEIKVKYLVTDAPSSYDMIIGWLTFNCLGAVFSTLYLCMKYLLPNGRVRVVQGDQEFASKC